MISQSDFTENINGKEYVRKKGDYVGFYEMRDIEDATGVVGMRNEGARRNMIVIMRGEKLVK